MGGVRRADGSMSAPIYPYSEWRHWPEEDIREWASEIAAAFSLAKYQASALVGELLTRAGHWRAPPEPADFPKRMTEETEASYAAAFFEWTAKRTDDARTDTETSEIQS